MSCNRIARLILEAVRGWSSALLCMAWLLAPMQRAIALERPAARQATKAEASLAFDVLHYSARIEPEISAGALHGSVVVDLRTLKHAPILAFDAGDLQVDAVRMAGRALRHEKQGRRLLVFLPEPVAAGTRMALEIEYHGSPTFGMEFHPEREEVYTIFSTSQWMVAVDAPSERASLDLELVLPARLKAAGTGEPQPPRTLKDGRVVHRWRQRAPVASFLYGFAAGRYVEVADDRDGLELRYLSDERDESELRRIFADTADMLAFFGNIAGVPYEGRYSQTLVADTVGQEMAGLALMSERYGREVLEDRSAESLIAHEVAHQWWGKLLTCKDWTHFWLNEGFATFMTAAYLQHRFGEAVYTSQVDGWKKRLERLRADGTDRALTFDRWFKPSADDRAVVYQKGAYVLHLLRERLGEDAFWAGIRAYTEQNQGQSVTGADFRRAMERSSGRDLSRFFAEWVDSTNPVDKVVPSLEATADVTRAAPTSTSRATKSVTVE